MTRAEFETLKRVIQNEDTLSFLFMERDWDFDALTILPDHLESRVEIEPDDDELFFKYLKEAVKNHIRDGSNLIDLYAKALVLVHDEPHDQDMFEPRNNAEERDQTLVTKRVDKFISDFWLAFWDGAEDAVVEPEHFDEEQ